MSIEHRLELTDYSAFLNQVLGPVVPGFPSFVGVKYIYRFGSTVDTVAFGNPACTLMPSGTPPSLGLALNHER